MEVQDSDNVKNRDWSSVLEHHNKLLQKPNNTDQQIFMHLLDRLDCLYHLGYHETIISDCRQILKSFNGKYNKLVEPKIRIHLIRSLFILNRITGRIYLTKS